MTNPIAPDEWKAEAVRRFGPDPMKWHFVCPSCGYVAAAKEWMDAGAGTGAMAFSCVGRWTTRDDSKTFGNAGGPCMYSGGGLIRMNPVHVQIPDSDEVHRVFAFAELRTWWCGWLVPDSVPEEHKGGEWPEGMSAWITGHSAFAPGGDHVTWVAVVRAATAQAAWQMISECYGPSAGDIGKRWEPELKPDDYVPSPDRFP